MTWATCQRFNQWARYDDEKERRLAERPICADCGEHIQDEKCAEFNGEYICLSCLEDLHMKDTEDCL